MPDGSAVALKPGSLLVIDTLVADHGVDFFTQKASFEQISFQAQLNELGALIDGHAVTLPRSMRSMRSRRTQLPRALIQDLGLPGPR